MRNDDNELWPTPGVRRQSVVAQSDSPLLRREGEYWTIVFDEHLIRLRDRKGLHYLALLLGQPGEQVSATELSRVVDGHEAAGPAGVAGSTQGRAASEAARVRVTRAVVAAVQQIRKHHESLGMHLLTTLRTGSACAYTPDSRVRIRWRVE